jgi:hypothetical protein
MYLRTFLENVQCIWILMDSLLFMLVLGPLFLAYLYNRTMVTKNIIPGFVNGRMPWWRLFFILKIAEGGLLFLAILLNINVLNLIHYVGTLLQGINDR